MAAIYWLTTAVNSDVMVEINLKVPTAAAIGDPVLHSSDVVAMADKDQAMMRGSAVVVMEDSWMAVVTVASDVEWMGLDWDGGWTEGNSVVANGFWSMSLMLASMIFDKGNPAGQCVHNLAAKKIH